VVLYVEQGVC